MAAMPVQKPCVCASSPACSHACSCHDAPTSHRIHFDAKGHPHAQRLNGAFGGNPITVRIPSGVRAWRIKRENGEDVLVDAAIDGVLILKKPGVYCFVFQVGKGDKVQAHLHATWHTVYTHGLAVRDCQAYSISPISKLPTGSGWVRFGTETQQQEELNAADDTPVEIVAQPDDSEEVAMKQKASRRRPCKSGINCAPWHNRHEGKNRFIRRQEAYFHYLDRRVFGRGKCRLHHTPKWVTAVCMMGFSIQVTVSPAWEQKAQGGQ